MPVVGQWQGVGPERGSWTHNICDGCWSKLFSKAPYRVVENFPAQCCFCGADTEGDIWIREEPESDRLICRHSGHHSKESGLSLNTKHFECYLVPVPPGDTCACGAPSDFCLPLLEDGLPTDKPGKGFCAKCFLGIVPEEAREEVTALLS